MHLATNWSEIRGAVESYECTLRKLAIGDDAFIDGVLASQRANLALSGLDPKSHALVRLGALIAVLPELGAARVISAAPRLGLAIGYDVAAALEDSASLPG